MIRKLFPFVLMIAGACAGLAAGFFLRPEEQEDTTESPAAPDSTATEFVKITNQFVIPIVDRERIASLLIVSISLEVDTGSSEQVYRSEPKLRDGILQSLFDHANTGGFRGPFTDADNLASLRRRLLDEARLVLGDTVRNVLITDIVRQDN